MKIKDHYNEIKDFEEVLSFAEKKASKDWDVTFVSSISERYGEYGEDTYLSVVQKEQLERISDL